MLISNHRESLMDRITKALHTRVEIDDAKAVVTPIFQSSAFQSDSPYFYTRKDNPNTRELEVVVSTLEESKYAVSLASGMAAISAVVDLLPPNSIIIINKYIYGCTYKFFQRIKSKKNIEIYPIDLSEISQIESINKKVDMVFFETPTNPFLKTVHIKNISNYFKNLNPKCLIVVDNTWATPLFQQPLKHGADISLHSATKFMSGHSDVMAGIVLTNSETIFEDIKSYRFYSGAVLAPYNAWLIRRSLQTLELRLKNHQSVTSDMRDWLSNIEYIEKVYYPTIDGDQLTGYGGIIFFQMKRKYEEIYSYFSRTLELFDTGTGMACVTSMVAQPYTGSHASMNDEEKVEIGLNKGLIRLCFGLENVDALKRDIAKSLELAINKIDKDSNIS